MSFALGMQILLKKFISSYMVESGEKVIAIAGTGLKADTALVMQAASTQDFTRLRVNEILCKPLNSL
jgi:hypothetical protein